MGLLDRIFQRNKPEYTFTAANPGNFLELIRSTDERVPTITREQAIGVPAVWGAINFLAGTVASLPVGVFTNRDEVRTPVRKNQSNPVVGVLADAVNDELTSYQWRYDAMVAILTDGRSVTYIERDARGRVINLFPLMDPTVERRADGTKWYRSGIAKGAITYPAGDVIDIPWMLKGDNLTHRSPLNQCAAALSKAYHANLYGTKVYSSGGVPPLVLEGPIASAEAARRASADIAQATQELAKQGRNILALPEGHTLKPIGYTPENTRFPEVENFSVTEIARIYGLPPTFIQDFTRATFSNSEQSDLHFVKHTLRRWVEAWESELNLKLFGRSASRYVEFKLDRILRGDYLSRAEANARAIQSGQRTPNELRSLDSLPPKEGGDQLLIQGATIPLTQAGQMDPAGTQGNLFEQPPTSEAEETDDG